MKNARAIVDTLLEQGPEHRQRQIELARAHYRDAQNRRGVPPEEIEAGWQRMLPNIEAAADQEWDMDQGEIPPHGPVEPWPEPAGQPPPAGQPLDPGNRPARARETIEVRRQRALELAKIHYFERKRQQGVPPDQIEAGWQRMLVPMQRAMDAGELDDDL